MTTSAGAPPTMQPIAEGDEEQDTAVEAPMRTSANASANEEEERHRQREHGDVQSSDNHFDTDDGRDGDSDDGITIYSVSSSGSMVGTSTNSNSLRRRSPGGSSSTNARSRTTGKSSSTTSGGGRHEDNDQTPIVANKRSSRMPYSKQLIKMGRDVFSPPRPRLSFLSPSQHADRKRLPSRRKSSGGSTGNPNSPGGSTASRASHVKTYQGPTDLHNICYSAVDSDVLHTAKFHALPQSTDSNGRTSGDEPVARATKVFSIVQREAAAKDRDGRTAMHVLSRNGKLARHSSETDEDGNPTCDPSNNFNLNGEPIITSIGAAALNNGEVSSVVEFVVNFLLPANPMALLEEDSEGEIPFEGGLVDWIRQVHDDEFGLHRQDGTSSSSFTGVNIENSLQQMQNVVGGVVTQSKAALANVGRSLHISGAVLSSTTNPNVAGTVANESENAAQMQNDLGRSSSWTIESSGSSDTLSPPHFRTVGRGAGTRKTREKAGRRPSSQVPIEVAQQHCECVQQRLSLQRETRLVRRVPL